jgi:hypothetical protein
LIILRIIKFSFVVLDKLNGSMVEVEAAALQEVLKGRAKLIYGEIIYV